jgi:hypothetical protein
MADVQDGLLYMLGGGVPRMWIDTFPLSLNAVLAIVIETSKTEVGRARFIEVAILDDQGNTINSQAGGFRVAVRAELDDRELTQTPFLVQLAGAQLPMPGYYRFEITLNGELARSISVRADLVPGTDPRVSPSGPVQ